MISGLNTKALVAKHSSFLMMGLGAASVFTTNIILKNNLNDIDYGKYSLFFTWIATLISFGFIGFDQVILRISRLESGKVLIDKHVFLYTALAGFFTSIIISVYLKSGLLASVHYTVIIIIFFFNNII